MKYLLVSLVVLSAAVVNAQGINKNWNGNLKNAIAEFKACENTTEAGVNSCNKFIGKTLKTVYKLNDFYSRDQNRYMLASEIYDYLQGNGQWTLLGKGYEQEALDRAQKLANEKKAVVAIYRNSSNEGHLAYILPGELQPSGSWKLRVPNSAAYFIDQPERSYCHKGLSYSFPRGLIQSVSLYARKY